MGSIQVGGVLYPLRNPATGMSVPVRRWNDRELPDVPEFKAGDGYNKMRHRPVDLFVWHWTGGEQDPIPMAETLRRRKLGVEFSISRDGVVFQFCDPLFVDTADAGIVNSRSVGCEIVCYGYRSAWDLKHAFGVPKVGQDRPTYEAVTHNVKMITAKFYAAQVQAAIALADAASSAMPAITRCVPSAGTQMMPPQALQRYQGHLGHFHVTDKKRDPGPWFMDQLRYAFAAKEIA